MKVESIILLAIFVALVSSKSASEFRIYNGNDAMEGQFPYQASLRNKRDTGLYEHRCGAVIINNRFLLTAAHCCYFGFKRVGDAIVVVGAFYRSGDGITMDVDKITPHADHDTWTAKNDIAIIRTVEKIPFSDKLQPVALPITYHIADDKKLLASGWGKIGTARASILQFVEIPALNLDECKSVYSANHFNKVTDTNVCTTGKYNTSPCEGDSGGPLVDPIHRTLVGLVSWGSVCDTGKPAVYTRVYSFMDWILAQMEEQSADFQYEEDEFY